MTSFWRRPCMVLPGVLIFALLSPGAGVGVSKVTGLVVDDVGKPVVHARVFIAEALPAGARHFAGPPTVTGPQVATTVTDQKGEFAVGLRPGNYIACAQSTTPGLLDPCHWAASPPVFTVAVNQAANPAASQSVAGVRISMAKGAVVNIHVDDPGKLLKSVPGSIDPECRIHFVTAKGFHYEAAIVAGKGAGGRDHAITLPFGAALTLRVLSPHLDIQDETGKSAVDNPKPVQFAAGATPAFLLTVKGVKP